MKVGDPAVHFRPDLHVGKVELGLGHVRLRSIHLGYIGCQGRNVRVILLLRYRELFGKRPCLQFAKLAPLVVERGATLEQVARMLANDDLLPGLRDVASRAPDGAHA